MRMYNRSVCIPKNNVKTTTFSCICKMYTITIHNIRTTHNSTDYLVTIIIQKQMNEYNFCRSYSVQCKFVSVITIPYAYIGNSNRQKWTYHLNGNAHLWLHEIPLRILSIKWYFYFRVEILSYTVTNGI